VKSQAKRSPSPPFFPFLLCKKGRSKKEHSKGNNCPAAPNFCNYPRDSGKKKEQQDKQKEPKESLSSFAKHCSSLLRFFFLFCFAKKEVASLSKKEKDEEAKNEERPAPLTSLAAPSILP
jgi:hypothetical protein